MSKEEEKGLEIDKSSSRLGFLYGRFEENASDYYSDYVLNNEIFKNEKMKIMSKITENTLKSIDYGFVRNRRNDNYQVLHKILGKYNELGVAETMDGAFAYPLLLKNGAEIRKALINRKIYVPVLWPDVFDNTKGNSIDYRYASDILPLPCDQRYSSDDMIIIADEIRHLI